MKNAYDGPLCAADIAHFSPLKKRLQKLGTALVRVLSRTDIRDAPSGFRVMSRAAAMQFNVVSEYTYTLETIIQAGQKGDGRPVGAHPGQRRHTTVAADGKSRLLRRTLGLLPVGTPGRRTERPSLLDPYRDFIAGQLALYPRLRATRIHDMIAERGDTGSMR